MPRGAEANTYNLPRGEAIRRALAACFREQRGQILALLAPRAKAADGPDMPAEWPPFRLGSLAMSERMTPLIEALWDDSGRDTMARLDIDPDRWRVTNPHTAAMIRQAALDFSASTNNTTSLQLADALKQTREALLAGVVTRGESVPKLTKRVNAIFDSAEKWRARRIAQTEASRAVHAAQEEASKQSGVVAGFRWLLSSDACPLCQTVARRAEYVQLGTPFAIVGDNPTYSGVRFPPLHPHCACTVQEVLKQHLSGEPEPRWARTLDQPVPEAEDYPDGQLPAPKAPAAPAPGPGPGPGGIPWKPIVGVAVGVGVALPAIGLALPRLLPLLVPKPTAGETPAQAPPRDAPKPSAAKPGRAPGPRPAAPARPPPSAAELEELRRSIAEVDARDRARREAEAAAFRERLGAYAAAVGGQKAAKVLEIGADAIAARQVYEAAAAYTNELRGMLAAEAHEVGRAQVAAALLKAQDAEVAALRATEDADARVRGRLAPILVPEGDRIEFEVPEKSLGSLPEDARRSAENAMLWYSRVTAASPKGAVKFAFRAMGAKGDQREYYEDGKVTLTRFTAVNTVVHELGHMLEEKVPGWNAAAQAFLRHRVGDEPLRPLSEVMSGDYQPSEVGRKDRFDQAFGDLGWYVGKDYGRSASEVTAMGVEKLFKDPAGFAKKDPEFFSFITGMLDGSLR